MPEQRMNCPERKSNIISIAGNHGLLIIHPVSYEYKLMLRVVTDHPPDNLVCEPSDAVTGHCPEGARINCYDHPLLPLLDYKCGN